MNKSTHRIERDLANWPHSHAHARTVLLTVAKDGWAMQHFVCVITSLILFLGSVVSFPAPAEANVLTKAAANAVARKAALRDAQAIATKAELRNAATALSKTEVAALQRELLALDRNTVARIEARYGNYIPAARLRDSARCSTCFLDRRAYDAHLQRAYPQLTAADRDLVLGDFRNGRTSVRSSGPDVPTTVAHERLHQLSHKGFRLQVGSKLDEGFTEHFSGRIYGDLAIKDRALVYPQGQRIVQMMQARAGEGSLATAYFSGNVAPLRQSLDRQLGRGAFDQITRSAERGEFTAAERILMRGL